MHSRKSRRALDLDLRTNSLESRQLLATPTPTATVAIFYRTTNLTKTALFLGAQQYIVWPSSPLSTKPGHSDQAADRTSGRRVYLHNQYEVHDAINAR